MNLILKVSIRILFVLLVLVICALVFLFTGDIKSIPPQNIEKKYQLKQERYKGRNVFILSPKEGTKVDTVVMYIHGGSYVGELNKEHWDFVEEIVDKTGCMVILPDYPLTPKNTYKEVFNMMEPLYKEIIKKVDTKNFIVMGDSAGGGLSLALLEKMGEEKVAQPNQLILLSPWLDITMKNEEITEVEKVDPELNRIALKMAGERYADDLDRNHYLVSPVNGPLKNLKNVTVYTGTYDMLNPDVHVLIENAQKEGVSIQLRQTEKATHVWMLKPNAYHYQETKAEIIEMVKNNKGVE